MPNDKSTFNSSNCKNNNSDPAKRIVCKATLSQRAADRASRIIGSWPFIISQSVFVISWMILNIFLLLKNWDPYPFVFLNLMLSIIATYSAPIILMSQNREAERDRIRTANDLATDRKALREIQRIQEQLERLEKKIGQ